MLIKVQTYLFRNKKQTSHTNDYKLCMVGRGSYISLAQLKAAIFHIELNYVRLLRYTSFEYTIAFLTDPILSSHIPLMQSAINGLFDRRFSLSALVISRS